MQSHLRRPDTVGPRSRDPEPPSLGPGDNAFAQEQLNDPTRSLELLADALGQVGGQRLAPEQQERLEAVRGRLSVARSLLAAGDVEAASGLLPELDRAAGALVKDTGTVLEMQGSGGEAFADVSTLYVNGMSQTLTESMARGQDLADLRGSDVGVVYNRSESFFEDLGEATAQKLQHVVPGYEHRTEEGGTLAAAIDERLDAGRQVDVVTHSQGANFAKEAVQRLDDTRADRSRLSDGLHLTLMGAPLDANELPDHFDNVTFLEERDDMVSNHLGRRDRDEDRSWWERLPIVGRDEPGDHEVIEFDHPDRGPFSGAHDPRTYLSHPDAVAALRRDPFE